MKNLDINKLSAYNKSIPYIEIGGGEYDLRMVLKLVERIIGTDECAKIGETYIPCDYLTKEEYELCRYFAIQTDKLVERIYDIGLYEETYGADGIGYSKNDDTDDFWNDLKIKLQKELDKLN